MTNASPEAEPRAPEERLLAKLMTTLAEDALAAIASGVDGGDLDDVAKRRGEAYTALLRGRELHTLAGHEGAYRHELVRILAPIHAPDWLPMATVLRDGVTLEGGARGLRSLFSSKPSAKERQRVSALGTLATRVMRAVCAADGPIDGEEQAAIAAFVSALGLEETEGARLLVEQVIPIEQLDVYGELDKSFIHALLAGAWMAAASDHGVDPREEHVVRVLASKVRVEAIKLEELKGNVVESLEHRRATADAASDALRFVLSDRIPGAGVVLASRAVGLLAPRRYRDEIVGHIAAGTPVVLSKRHELGSAAAQRVLSIAWCAALWDDPTWSR